MKIQCCGIWQSTSDVEDYIFFDKYTVKPLIKNNVGKFKVSQEIVYCHSCKVCGALTVQIVRKGKMLGKKAVLEIENLKGQKALEFLTKTADRRYFVEIPNPAKPSVHYSKFIPLAYGKKIDAFTQRKRYVNESDWADKFVGFKDKKTITSDLYGGKKQVIVQDAVWKPDIIKSEVKITKVEDLRT